MSKVDWRSPRAFIEKNQLRMIGNNGGDKEGPVPSLAENHNYNKGKWRVKRLACMENNWPATNTGRGALPVVAETALSVAPGSFRIQPARRRKASRRLSALLRIPRYYDLVGIASPAVSCNDGSTGTKLYSRKRHHGATGDCSCRR